MEEFISSIINSSVDFNQIGKLFLIWIAALWVVFCVWVFVDAKKRYKDRSFGIFWFCIVLVLNFPALVLYMIIRPENEENHVIYFANEGSQATGGINVPLVNFTGEDGIVQLSLSLSLNKSIGENVQFDLKVNDNDKYKVEDKAVSVEVETEKAQSTNPNAPTKKKVTISGLKTQVVSLKNSLKSKLSRSKTAPINDETVVVESSEPAI